MKPFNLKPLLVSLVLAGLVSMPALAKEYVNLSSDTIVGYQPYVASIGVKVQGKEVGTKNAIEIGDVLEIPATYDENYYAIKDGDGDELNGGDNSLTTVKWYIVKADGSRTEIESARGSRTLTVPFQAKDNFIGFEITPTTKKGDPRAGAGLMVPNIIYMAGQLPPGVSDPSQAPGKPGLGVPPGGGSGPNGEPGVGETAQPLPDPDKPNQGNPNFTDPNDPNPDDGKVGGELPKVIVAILDDKGNVFAGVDAKNNFAEVASKHITVNASYSLKIYELDGTSYKETQDYTKYKDWIKWSLKDEQTGQVTKFLPDVTYNARKPVSADGLTFKTQPTNAARLMQSQSNLSEQGLILNVILDDGQN